MRPSRFRPALTASLRRQKLNGFFICDCVAGLERPDDSRVPFKLPHCIKPVDLGAPDWATSRQPQIVCELFDPPDITSFLRTWVFVTQIRVIVQLTSCMNFVPRPKKLRSLHFRKSAPQRLAKAMPQIAYRRATVYNLAPQLSYRR